MCAAYIFSYKNAKSCDNERISSKSDCMFDATDSYLLVSSFHTPQVRSSKQSSNITISRIWGIKIDFKSNITVFERVKHTLTVTCNNAEFTVQGNSSEKSELVNIELNLLSEGFSLIYDYHFGNILPKINRTEFINKTDLLKITRDFESGIEVGFLCLTVLKNCFMGASWNSCNLYWNCNFYIHSDKN